MRPRSESASTSPTTSCPESGGSPPTTPKQCPPSPWTGSPTPSCATRDPPRRAPGRPHLPAQALQRTPHRGTSSPCPGPPGGGGPDKFEEGSAVNDPQLSVARPGPNDPAGAERRQVQEVPPRGRRTLGSPGTPAPASEARAHLPMRTFPLEISSPRLHPLRDGPDPAPRGDPATRVDRMRRACQAAAQVLQEARQSRAPRRSPPTRSTPSRTPPTSSAAATRARSTTTASRRAVHLGQRGRLPRHPRQPGPRGGDIVNLDVTIFLEGMHGDCSATFVVGKVDEAAGS